MNASIWTFCVSLYRQPGVEEHCLSLQDRFGVNVNVFLLSIYAGSEFGVTMSRDDIDRVDGTIREWHTQVVETLRALRRFLKPLNSRRESPNARITDSLRTQIKGVELEAERIEVGLLQEWFDSRVPGWPQGARHTAVVANLHCVLSYYGAGTCTEASRQLIDLALCSLGGR